MEAKFLYINGEFVHNNAELLKMIRKLINSERDKDATIKLLSDLYRNGHLRTFCHDITFDVGPSRGDTEIANHILSKLSGEIATPIFDLDLFSRITIDSIAISRQDEMPIQIVKSSKSDQSSELTFLMDGYRKHKYVNQLAYVDINYTVRKPINEVIPIYIGASKASLILSSAGKKNLIVEIPESILNPQNDVTILLGAQGRHGKICLKAPQINIPITYLNKKVSYALMRIIKKPKEIFYMGVWPFEYDNKKEVSSSGVLLLPGWGYLLEKDNYLLQNWFQNAKINFLLYPKEYCPKTDLNSMWSYYKDRITDFVLKPIKKNDARLTLPTIEEWEFTSFTKEGTDMPIDIPDFKGNAVICAEGNQHIVLSSNNLKKEHNLKKELRPNSHGIYAMLGNIYELAINYTENSSYSFFMGGDISNSYNCKCIAFHEIEKVPFWGFRFVIRDLIE